MTVEDRISRKAFIAGAGAMAAGLAVSGGLLLGGCTSGGEPTAAVPKWPWPYEKLDPEAVRRKGYESFYEGYCCYGAFNGIIGSLREKIGHPYTMFPVEMFRFGEGGMAGWSSLCGSLIGGGAALTLVAGPNAYSQLVHEMMGFYTEASFPNSNHDGYAKFSGQTQSVSGSPLCHVSVTNWCKASGHKSFSEEREDRCAKVAGDVAALAAALLNKHADGTFAPTYVLPSVVQTCRGCHDRGSILENTRGMMDCTQCHDPHNV